MWFFIFFICFLFRIPISLIDYFFRRKNNFLLNDPRHDLKRVIGFNSIKLIPLMVIEVVGACVLTFQKPIFGIIAATAVAQLIIVTIDTRSHILDKTGNYLFYFTLYFLQAALVAWAFL